MDSVGEAAALEVEDVVLVVLLVELLVELGCSDDGFSPEQPATTNPMTAAVPTAEIATRCLTMKPLQSSPSRLHNIYAVEPGAAFLF
jgi:hypothetical protein